MHPPAISAEHWGLEAVLATLAAALNFAFAAQITAVPRRRVAVGAILTVYTTLSLSTSAAAGIRMFDWTPGVQWIRAMGFFWFLVSPAILAAMFFWNRAGDGAHAGPANAGRRLLLRSAASVAVAPVAALAYGVHVARRDAMVRELELPCANLPKDLDGLKIVQVSDIHLSPFVSREQLRRAVDQANEARADIAVVTGDLITSYGDPLDDAFAELKRLRATAGVFGCHGNHEILAGAEDYATRAGARQGLKFLRKENAALRFGSARLNLAGVDYQRKGRGYLAGAASLVDESAFNLLLSHNPDVFPVAAKQGWDLTLAGHTHGGQVTLEYLDPALNPARFYTPYTYGLYRDRGRAIYVTRGLGTIGVPVRLGAAPEIAVIRLQKA